MTPEEQKVLDKVHKKQREVVKKICNRLTMQFSFGNVKTWTDIYKITGYDDTYISANFKSEHCSAPVTIVEVRSWCKKLTDDLENTIKGIKPAVEVQPVVIQPIVQEKSSIQIPKEQPHFQPASTVSSQPDESGFNNSNDYGLAPSPNEKAFLFWFQKKATKESVDKIVKEKKPAILVLASTGTGKTYIKGAIERRLADLKFLEEFTWGLSKTINVTRSTVVEQDKRVLNEKFCLRHPDQIETINIEMLRSRAGQMWVGSKSVIVNGEEKTQWDWKQMINPVRFHLDECQAVKNEGTIQHDIVTQYFKIKTPTVAIFYSATPFTRVSEAKAFAIATKKDISHLGFPAGTKLSVETWPTYAAAIAAPSPPDEYNEAAVERLMKDLDEYVVRVKGVRWQFNAVNGVEIIDFEAPNESNNYTNTRKEYAEAWDRYVEMMAKLELAVTDNPRFQALVELMMFLIAAEYSKRYIFAKRMYEDVQAGYAAVLACKNKKTIIAVTKILNEKYGVPRNKISLIWGGGQTQLTKKQKLKQKILENKEAFDKAGISMEDMMLDEVETRVLEELPEHLRLGIQSKEERQREIDRFQRGESLYAIYTFKAGGVGLSLHHTDEFTNVKVRRQKNGYAVVEDIPNIPTRPRKTTVSPTWSPIEMVQGVGRVPRLTSLSDSYQTLLFYRGTVEEEQAFVVTHRLKCLSKVVRQHESWQDLITNHVRAKEIARELVEKGPAPDKEGEEHDGLTGSEEEEDE